MDGPAGIYRGTRDSSANNRTVICRALHHSQCIPDYLTERCRRDEIVCYIRNKLLSTLTNTQVYYDQENKIQFS